MPVPHDYYDRHSPEPHLHNKHNHACYIEPDWQANLAKDQLPDLSTIGRGPKGDGLYIGTIRQNDTSVSFDVCSDLTGEVISTVGPFPTGSIKVYGDPIHESTAGEEVKFYVDYNVYDAETNSIKTKTTELTIPPGATGSLIYLYEDTLDRTSDDTYQVNEKDLRIYNKKKYPEKPAVRVNDIIILPTHRRYPSTKDRGAYDKYWLTFGTVEAVEKGKVVFTARTFFDYGLDALISVYRFMGTVETYEDLPNDASNGDVYNVQQKHGDVPAGTNWAWSSDENRWDSLGGAIDWNGIATEQYVNTKVSEAVDDAEEYTDTKAAETLATAKTYADTKDTATLAEAKEYADTKASETLDAANDYTDEAVSQLSMDYNDLENKPLILTDTQEEQKEYQINFRGADNQIWFEFDPNTEQVDLSKLYITNEIWSYTPGTPVEIRIGEYSATSPGFEDAGIGGKSVANLTWTPSVPTIPSDRIGLYYDPSIPDVTAVWYSAVKHEVEVSLDLGIVPSIKEPGYDICDKAFILSLVDYGIGFYFILEGSITVDVLEYNTRNDVDSYNIWDKLDHPDFAIVATTGDYNDLENTPECTEVSVVSKLSTGTNIAEIEVDGTVTQLYAPSGGGGNLQNLVDGSTSGSVRGISTVPESSFYTMGDSAFAEGLDTRASGNYSHAEGDIAQALGIASHAEGDETTASGNASHAEGQQSSSSGIASHAEGISCGAYNTASHAEGCFCSTRANYSHAEGQQSSSSGLASHAEGRECFAMAPYSHAQNYGTRAVTRSQTTIGEYNELDQKGSVNTRGEYALIIGNGTDNNNRSNAFAVAWDGTMEAAGDVIDGDGNSLADLAAAQPDDYIVEQGVDSGFTYRKWKSGKVEAWDRYTYQYPGDWVSWVSPLYYRDITSSIPAGIFSSAPNIIATSKATDNYASWVVGAYASSATSYTIKLAAVTNSQQPEVNLYLYTV